MAEGVQRAPYPDHPNRCQSQIQNGSHAGQCNNLAMEGSEYCQLHGGNKANPPLKELNLYRIRKFQARLTDFKSANGARTLDEELALLRMLLEETVNKCEDETDLMLYSTKIGELVNDIKGLVLAADKLATKAGTLIGRSEAMVIAGKTVEIISRFVTDEKTLGLIAEEIANVFITAPDSEL